MVAALFGLSPSALAILAAVCSPRLGICALHGQLFYFAGLLLYSPFPLTINSLWLVPFMACLFFCIGLVLAFFIVRDDFTPSSDGGRRIFTAVLVLINFALLLLLLHSVFSIMCFRLDQALHVPAVKLFSLIVKVTSGALLVWLFLAFLLRRRRAGWASIYALLGLWFSSYIILSQSAHKITWPMPLNLQRALQLKANMEYYTIANSAEFSTFIYFMPPVLALICGSAGYFLLKPTRKHASASQQYGK